MEREAHTKLVQTRLREKDFAAVVKAALDEGLPVATWLRRVILEKLKEGQAGKPL